MPRHKQQKPERVRDGLGSLEPSTTLRAAWAALEDDFVAPQRRARRRQSPKTAVSKENTARSATFGIFDACFCSPYDGDQDGKEWTINTELIHAADLRQGHNSLTLLSISACGRTNQVPDVQVLLPVPNPATATSFLRLLDSNRLALSLAPCTHLADLLYEVAAAQGSGADSGRAKHASQAAETALLYAVAATPAPLLLQSQCLVSGPTDPRANHDDSASQQGQQQQQQHQQHQQEQQQGWHVLQPVIHAVGLEAAQLVLHQGVDVVYAAPEQSSRRASAGAPSSHASAGLLPHTRPPMATPAPGLLLEDSLPWPSTRLLSSRISGMLLPSEQPAAGPSQAQPGDPSMPLPATELERQVLLPGAQDGMWSLTIQLGEALLPKSVHGVEVQEAGRDAYKHEEGVGHGTGGEGEVSRAVGGGDSDAEAEDRAPWQDDLLHVLRWLLPHATPHKQQHSSDQQQQQQHQRQHTVGTSGSEPQQPVDAAATPGSPRGHTHRSSANGSPRGFKHGSQQQGASAGGFSAAALYNLVKPSGREEQYQAALPELIPELRPYQRRAVAWMLSRECGQMAVPTETHPVRLGNGVTSAMASDEQGMAEPSSIAAIPSGAEAVPDDLAPGDGVACAGVSQSSNRRKGRKAATQQGSVGRAACLSEAGDLQGIAGGGGSGPGSPQLLHPLWRRLVTLGGRSMYVNPFSGRLAHKAPLPAAAGIESIKGGILCDEMGLGKTVELLACILAHRYQPTQPVLPASPTPAPEDTGDEADDDTRRKRRRTGKQAGGRAINQPREGAVEHISCTCGYERQDPGDDGGYQGLWVMCDMCLAWMHGECVGIPRTPPAGQFACSRCLRATALERVSGPCGATLVVCPAAILRQWWGEIHKHVQPGQVKVVVYLGQQQDKALASQGMWAAPGPAASGEAEDSSLLPLVVSASDLAAADIVLTTYDVLKRDVDRQPEMEVAAKQLRRQKRYHVVPTPLTRLTWWRVVLDEAQMVESSTAKATEMARKLHAVHRWCVTGTPISRGLEDVYGLLSFLRVRPWASHVWWMRAIQRPAESGCPVAMARLLATLRPALGGLMWRTAKRDVLQELGIPPQHHHVTWLHHSPVERHFYIRQHQECASKVRAVLPSSLLSAAAQHTGATTTIQHVVIDQPDTDPTEQPAAMQQLERPPMPGLSGPPPVDLSAPGRSEAPSHAPTIAQGQTHRPSAAGVTGGSAAAPARGALALANRALTQDEQKKILLPLLRLRQAACHPQVGAGGIKAVTAQRAPLTMDEILGVLTSKAKYEAEEAQRALVHALNGLAALMVLERGQAGRADAIAAYREAVHEMETNSKEISTDPLQQLHTFHNLAQLVASHVQGVAPTLRDSTLERDAAALRAKYLDQRSVRLAVQQADYDKSLRAAEPFNAHHGWFVTAIQMLQDTASSGVGHSEEDIVAALRERLLEDDTRRFRTDRNASNMGNRFRSLRQLQRLLVDALDSVESARDKAMTRLQELTVATSAASPQFVEQAGHCQRCRADLRRRGRVCDHCLQEELMVKWEVHLFSIHTRALAAGQQVSDEDAARRAAANMLRRVGQGGLGEGDDDKALEAAGLLEGSRRDMDGAVAAAQISWKPSDAEQVLKMLAQRLGQVANAAVGARVLDRGQVDEVLARAKDHLERLEAQRKLFAQARALTLAQRWLLYAHDELDMAVARTRLRQPGEWVDPSEEAFKIWPEEIPIRNKDLSNDKVIAKADLQRTLGTLRYLRTLQAARQLASQPQPGQPTVGAEPQQGEAAAATVAAQGHGAPETSLQPGSVAMEIEPIAGLAGAADAAGQKVGVVVNGEGQAEPRVLDSRNHTGAGSSSMAAADTAAAAAAVGVLAAPPVRTVSLPAAAAAAPAGAAGAAGPSAVHEICPICHDAIGTQFSMVPCGHMVCSDCMAMLLGHVPTNVPASQRKVSCPTCRSRFLITEVSQVDGGGGTRSTREARARTYHLPGMDPGSGSPPAAAVAAMSGEVVPHEACAEDLWAGEGDVTVSGSYGTKVEAVARRLMFITRSDPTARVVVFSSWLDLLELVAHALATNRLPYAFAKARQNFHAALAAFKGETPQAVSNGRRPKGQRATTITAEGALTKPVQWEVSDSEKEMEVKDDIGAQGQGSGGCQQAVEPKAVSEADPQQEQVLEEANGLGTEDTGAMQLLVPKGARGGRTGPHMARGRAGGKRKGRGAGPGLPADEDQHAPASLNQAPSRQDQDAVMAETAVTDGNCDAGQPPQQQGGGQTQQGDGHTQQNQGQRQGRQSGRRGQASYKANNQLPRVLLLLMSQGGAGLNLTEAQHVVLVEPHTDPASELQAVGRVHRIGQTRETHVHRFVVHHTVEENVFALGASRSAAMDMTHAASAGSTGREGGAKEGLATVSDVALLLTTPWSEAEARVAQPPAAAGTAGQPAEPGGEALGPRVMGADQAGCSGAHGADVRDGPGASAVAAPGMTRLVTPAAAAAAAAEARWRMQQPQGGQQQQQSEH